MGSSLKQQALKLIQWAGGPTSAQAAGRKLSDRGAWLEIIFRKFRGPGIEGRKQDPGVRGVLNMEGNLVR